MDPFEERQRGMSSVRAPRVFVISTSAAPLARAAACLREVRRPGPQDIRVACHVETSNSVDAACDRLTQQVPDVVVLLQQDADPSVCLEACARLQAALAEQDVPLAVIFPSTDPSVWQEIYASGANMFLPWHGNVLEGLPTYVGSLLTSLRGSRISDQARASILIDEGEQAVWIHGWHATFTPYQFCILAHLVANEGRVVSRAELAEVLTRAHDESAPPAASSLYEHISQIRKRLGPHGAVVRSVRRQGYTFDIARAAA